MQDGCTIWSVSVARSCAFALVGMGDDFMNCTKLAQGQNLPGLLGYWAYSRLKRIPFWWTQSSRDIHRQVRTP